MSLAEATWPQIHPAPPPMISVSLQERLVWPPVTRRPGSDRLVQVWGQMAGAKGKHTTRVCFPPHLLVGWAAINPSESLTEPPIEDTERILKRYVNRAVVNAEPV